MQIKVIISLACILLLVTQVQGQQTTAEKKELSPADMLRKGRTEKIVGPLLMAAGAGIIVVALNTDKTTTLGNLGSAVSEIALIATLGAAVSTVGIVVFSNGTKRVRKAKLMMSYESVPFFHKQSVGIVGLKISLPLNH